jgi:uncharacterized protein with FMN-binding domain
LATKGPSVHAIAPPRVAVNDERSRLPAMRRVGKAAASNAPHGRPAAATAAVAASPAADPAVGATPGAAPGAAPAAPAPMPQPAAASPTPDTTVAAPDTKNEGDQLKDGVFYGWGTSRHGDIQASVEIKSGKIVGAYISQCLTRYSCSWISMLPPEVVQRQSAEVDYVSGATQSSNAFYYAIVEALKAAK